jgi:hypothetical protein
MDLEEGGADRIMMKMPDDVEHPMMGTGHSVHPYGHGELVVDLSEHSLRSGSVLGQRTANSNACRCVGTTRFISVGKMA